MNSCHNGLGSAWGGQATAAQPPPFFGPQFGQPSPFNNPQISQHTIRMQALARDDQQLAETLNGLMALTGFRLESECITGSECAPVDGGNIIWRVSSVKYRLEVVWIDTSTPTLQSFQFHFARLADAVAERREEMIKKGEPLPPDPPNEDELRAKYEAVLQQLQFMAQQQAPAGVARVFDQRAFQQWAMDQLGIQGQSNHLQNTSGQLQQNAAMYGTAVAPAVSVAIAVTR